MIVINWRDTTHFDSEDDYRTDRRNVSHCQQQQSYSGLRSTGRSNSTYFWNDSWVPTFHKKGTGDEMCLAIVSVIVTGDAPVIYRPILFLVLSNSPKSLCESLLVPVSVLLQNRPRDSKALGLRLQIFHDSIVSQFPKETWVQRKPNQIKKNDQKAWESRYNFDISWAIESLQ